MDDLSTVAILIPAWKPEPALIAIVAQLLEQNVGEVVLVDDGNDGEARNIFALAAADERVSVIRHAVNLGKGRALKTGINYILSERPHIRHVVTADADGQHTVRDIAAVAQQLQQHPNRTILGVRTFSADVPLRSRFGNTLTRRVFALVTGVRLADTQTGLRGLPREVLPDLLRLDGDRYEYEMTMLAHLCRGGEPPIEVPIETVYIDNNRSSHFDPVRDSMRIYFVLLRFYFSSLVAAAIDLVAFTLVFLFTHNLLLSVAIARLSSLVNFTLNRRFVFHNYQSLGSSLWRYYLLASGLAAASYLLIDGLTTSLHWNVFAAKIAIDVLLSLLSFAAQRTFVFGRAKES